MCFGWQASDSTVFRSCRSPLRASLRLRFFTVAALFAYSTRSQDECLRWRQCCSNNWQELVCERCLSSGLEGAWRSERGRREADDKRRGDLAQASHTNCTLSRATFVSHVSSGITEAPVVHVKRGLSELQNRANRKSEPKGKKTRAILSMVADHAGIKNRVRRVRHSNPRVLLDIFEMQEIEASRNTGSFKHPAAEFQDHHDAC